MRSGCTSSIRKPVRWVFDLGQYPRHVHANPLVPAICPLLAMAIYFATNPPQRDEPRLFPGKDQDHRYNRNLKRVMEATPELIAETRARGIVLDDIGTHSVRKGASTYAASGTTACPSHTAVCVRAGWSMGNVLSVYLHYESVGDQHVGCTVAGLPWDRAEFGILLWVRPGDRATFRAHVRGSLLA